jgi:hypothetical protein
MCSFYMVRVLLIVVVLFYFLKYKILKDLNMDVKHIALVISACCVLHNFYHMNHDIRRSGIAGMQDPHPNLNVNRGVPT